MNDNSNKRLGTSSVLWNLDDLYAGIDDPAVENDIRKCETEAEEIRNGYTGRVKSLNAGDLSVLVERLEKLDNLLGRLSTFAYLNFATRTMDPEAGAFLQKIKEAASRINKKTVFFELEWNQIEESAAKRLLADPVLDHYRHYLTALRRYAAHLLSQTEETLLIEKAPVGRGSWINLFDKVMGHMSFGEKGRTEEEVLADLYNEDREVRKQAAADLTDGLSGQLHILTHIYNTLAADKMIDDRLRHYDSWIGSMNLYNELEERTVEVLIDSVTARYDIPQRYYRIKRALLNLPELTDYDRYAPLPRLPGEEVSWPECRETVLAAFNGFSTEMAEIAALFFDKNWIHAPVRKGKRGGAFAHPCIPEVHPYVMVNYTGNLRDLSTVAHELGHGVHQFMAAERGFYNCSTTLVMAETASVFAELLLFNSQLEMIKDGAARRAFICQKLESIFATVFRQVAMNRFEDLTHTARRKKGELSADELSAHWLATQKKMFGDSVTLTDGYAVWWSYIPHFLSTPGYVYSYAFGELLVLALYRLYRLDKKEFVPGYIRLLKAGGSLSPYELLKPFGVDLDTPQFWQGGLEIIDEMLKEVE